MRIAVSISILMIITGLALTAVPFAFADQIKISIPEGSAVPGCETTQSCYIPSQVTVHPRDVVVWSNDDAAVHTVTSGVSTADGKFDSGMIMPEKTFANTFDTLGEYPYFCTVHPWMTGSVLVTVGGGIEVPMGAIIVGSNPEKGTTVTGLSSDGKVRVEITADNPIKDSTMTIKVTFRDSSGGTVKQDANYDIVAMQNGKQVLSELGWYAKEGNGVHVTKTLESNDSVDINVRLLGFGVGDESQWSGPKGEVLMFNVVPEFGAIAMIILGIAIMSTIAATAKSKFMLKL
jgi:predicted secreted protein with PEFG-CTERM motif